MSKPSRFKILMNAFSILTITSVAVVMLAVASKPGHRIGTASVFASRANGAPAPGQDASLFRKRQGQVSSRLEALPLAFEPNVGQTDPQVKYMARGNGYTVFLTENETVFALTGSSSSASTPTKRLGARLAAESRVQVRHTANVGMRLVGANSNPHFVASDELPGILNYYVGPDSKKWREGIKTYAQVSHKDVYPGVTMAFYGKQKQLEFDFVIAPGADPKPIQLKFSGARLATDNSGNLVLSSTGGDVILHKPVAYQDEDGKRQSVDVAFLTKDANTVALRLGNYDRARELVVDPALTYATYLGGSAEDEAFGVAIDGSGNVYVTGQTSSPSFGGKAAGPNLDVFVSEVNPTGTALVYTSIFSATGTGASNCSGNGIATDSAGDAFVGGSASVGFPTTILQTAFGGGSGTAPLDGFVLKLAPATGALTYSTYLGGSGNDTVEGIAVDTASPPNVFVAGVTTSTDFPSASSSPIQSSNGGTQDAFVTKIAGSFNSIGFSTYLGGSSGDLATGIALDGSGNAYVTGITVSSNFPTTAGSLQTTAPGPDDSFVTEIKGDGSSIVYSTYLGGSGSDDALGIAVDSAGEAYVTGGTNSSDFPVVNAAQSTLGGSSALNVFVSKLTADGSGLLFSTYWGGSQSDEATGIALDSFGDAYVTGRTTSSNYPTSGSPFQGSLSGSSDALIAEFSNTGFVVYSSFLGGTGTENGLAGLDAQSALGAITVDSTGNAYIAGATASTTSFPVTTGVYQKLYGGGAADGFVAKVGPAPADFSVAVSPSTISTTSGQTTSAITVTVSSVNSSYGQSVTLSCGGLPAKGVCNFSPASVTPGTTSQTSSLTIGTGGSSSARVLFPGNDHLRNMLLAALLPVFGLAFFVPINSRSGRLRGTIFVGLVVLALITLPACGGSSGGGGGGGGGGTTPGSYSITVIGTASSTTHSAPLSLKVN